MLLALTICAAAIIAVALTAQNTDIDAYAYIGYAKLPGFSQAYSPPAFSFGRGFEGIGKHWGSRLPPLDYGPLWLATERALVRNAPSYLSALYVLRAFNVVCIVAATGALYRMTRSPTVGCLTALNPALYYYYVVEAHNDVFPIALILIAIAFCARRPWVAAALAGAAGLIKISFAAIGLLALPAAVEKRSRMRHIAAVAVVNALGYALFAGPAFLRGALHVGHEQLFKRYDTLHVAGIGLHACIALIAAVALVIAIRRSSYNGKAAYAFSGISTIVYPWYLGWGLPYAARSPRFIAIFLISLPAVSHVMDPNLSFYGAHTFVGVWFCEIALICLLLLDGVSGKIHAVPLALARRKSA